MAQRMFTSLPLAKVALGAPSHDVTVATKSRVDFLGVLESREEGQGKALGPGKLLSSLSHWLPAPSLCHPLHPEAMACVDAAIGLHDEDAGRVVASYLRAFMDRVGLQPVPAKRRTLGPELFAHLQAIAGALPRLPYRERLAIAPTLQVVGAMVEALHRTSAKLGGSWDALVEVEARASALASQGLDGEALLFDLAGRMRGDDGAVDRLRLKQWIYALLHASGAGEWSWLGLGAQQVAAELSRQLRDAIATRNFVFLQETAACLSPAQPLELPLPADRGEPHSDVDDVWSKAFLRLNDALEDRIRRLGDLSTSCHSLRPPGALKDGETPSTGLGLNETAQPLSLAELVRLATDPSRPEIPGLKKVGGALQQMGRAGLGLVQKGITSFFGVQAPALVKEPHPTDAPTVLVFVIGGISLNEIGRLRRLRGGEGHDPAAGRRSLNEEEDWGFGDEEQEQVSSIVGEEDPFYGTPLVLGGTCLTNPERILEAVFETGVVGSEAARR